MLLSVRLCRRYCLKSPMRMALRCTVFGGIVIIAKKKVHREAVSSSPSLLLR
jgi:hypothetical protein